MAAAEDAELAASRTGDAVKALHALRKKNAQLLKEYLEEHAVEKVLGALMDELFSNPTLPENPYQFLARRLLAVETGLSLLPDGDEAVAAALQADVASASDASQVCHIVGDYSCWGLPHLLRWCDPAGLAELRLSVAPVLFSDEAAEDGPDGKLRCLYSVRGPSCLAGRLQPFVSDMDVGADLVVEGASLERCLGAASRRVLEKAVGLSATRRHLLEGVFVGDGQRWTAETMLSNRKGFVAAVNAAFVVKKPVVLRAILCAEGNSVAGRLDDGKSMEICSQRGAAAATVVGPLIRLEASFVFHFRDSSKGSTQSFAAIPLESLVRGVFFSQQSAEIYRSLFSGSDGMIAAATQAAQQLLDTRLLAAEDAGDTFGMFSFGLLRELVSSLPNDAVRPLAAQQFQLMRLPAASLRAAASQLETMDSAVKLIVEEPTRSSLFLEALPRIVQRACDLILGACEARMASSTVDQGSPRLDYLASEVRKLAAESVLWFADARSMFIDGAAASSALAQSTASNERDGESARARILRCPLLSPSGSETLVALHTQLFATAQSLAEELAAFLRAPTALAARVRAKAQALSHMRDQQAALHCTRVLSRRRVVAVEANAQLNRQGGHVPLALARESVLLQYATDTQLDLFLSRCIAQTAAGPLTPQPYAFLVRQARAEVLRFQGWRESSDRPVPLRSVPLQGGGVLHRVRSHTVAQVLSLTHSDATSIGAKTLSCTDLYGSRAALSVSFSAAAPRTCSPQMLLLLITHCLQLADPPRLVAFVRGFHQNAVARAVPLATGQSIRCEQLVALSGSCTLLHGLLPPSALRDVQVSRLFVFHGPSFQQVAQLFVSAVLKYLQWLVTSTKHLLLRASAANSEIDTAQLRREAYRKRVEQVVIKALRTRRRIVIEGLFLWSRDRDTSRDDEPMPEFDMDTAAADGPPPPASSRRSDSAQAIMARRAASQSKRAATGDSEFSQSPGADGPRAEKPDAPRYVPLTIELGLAFSSTVAAVREVFIADTPERFFTTLCWEERDADQLFQSLLWGTSPEAEAQRRVDFVQSLDESIAAALRRADLTTAYVGVLLAASCSGDSEMLEEASRLFRTEVGSLFKFEAQAATLATLLRVANDAQMRLRLRGETLAQHVLELHRGAHAWLILNDECVFFEGARARLRSLLEKARALAPDLCNDAGAASPELAGLLPVIEEARGLVAAVRGAAEQAFHANCPRVASEFARVRLAEQDRLNDRGKQVTQVAGAGKTALGIMRSETAESLAAQIQ